jgi:hypothetical protein
MSDPKRLLDTRELGELGKSALGAAVELDPPAGARERVWSDLGARLPLAGDPVPDLAADVGGAGLGGVGGAAAAGTASTLGVTVAKVTGGLVALAAIATGGAVATGAFDASPPKPAPAVSAAVNTPKAGGTKPASTADARPAPDPNSVPAAMASSSEAAKASLKAAPGEATTRQPLVRSGSERRMPAAVETSQAAPSTASFPTTETGPASAPDKATGSDLVAAVREESRLVGAAREALRAGDARAALALLAQARERFPAGVLGQERAALGVEASLQSGARAEALESGRRFLAAFPNSPHAARVRALIATNPTR